MVKPDRATYVRIAVYVLCSYILTHVCSVIPLFKDRRALNVTLYLYIAFLVRLMLNHYYLNVKLLLLYYQYIIIAIYKGNQQLTFNCPLALLSRWKSIVI